MASSAVTQAAATHSSGFFSGLLKAVTNLPKDIWKAVAGFVVAVLTAILHFLVWVLMGLFDVIVKNEITIVLQQAPWAQSLLAMLIAVAYSVLVLRTVWEFWQRHVSRVEGEPSDFAGTLRRVVYSGVAIPVGPWLLLRIIAWANDMATGVIHVVSPAMAMSPSKLLVVLLGQAAAIGAGIGVGALGAVATIGVAGLSLTGTPLVLAIALLPVLVYVLLLLLVLFQVAVRSIEFLLAAFIAPFAALGYMSPDDGMARTWLQQVLILAGSQIVQVMMLYVSLGMLQQPGVSLGMRMVLAGAAVYVAIRGPHILKQYAYHTGGGGMAAGAAQTAWRAMRGG